MKSARRSIKKSTTVYPEHMMIPKALYEALPFLCVGCGSLAWMAAQNPAGAAFAVMLTAAGVLIARMRWGYRRAGR
jgi:hypothetical protein